MFVQVIGSAAGRWLSLMEFNCANCDGFRMGTLSAQARTKSSIAVSDDGERGILFNASPDVRTQLASFSAMRPARTLRGAGIDAVPAKCKILIHINNTNPILNEDSRPEELRIMQVRECRN